MSIIVTDRTPNSESEIEMTKNKIITSANWFRRIKVFSAPYWKQ